MKLKPGRIAVFFLIGLLLFPGFAPYLVAPYLMAQTAPPPAQPAAMPTPQELDQLLAPVALYPDSLLAQITTASTTPQQILDVDNWLAQNQNLSGEPLIDAAQKQGFDPAFLALITFPQVIQMMAENIDDYAAIGQAFQSDQGAVSASIQRLRNQAYQAGSLRSSSQQQVQVQQSGGAPNYVIEPANPQTVYVPTYDPTIVYASPGPGIVATSLITFGVGIGIGALLVANRPWGWGGWGWNWGGRRVYYNHAVWGGWHGGYRPSNAWYRPRPVVYHNRPGFGGNWNYRPRNYRPPVPNRRPTYTRPGVRPVPGNRPSPGGGRPGQGGTRPGGPQPGNRPGGTHSGGFGNSRPQQPRPGGTRPSPTPRPAPTQRPATPRPSQGQRPGGNTRPQGSGNFSRPSQGNAQRPQGQAQRGGQPSRSSGERKK